MVDRQILWYKSSKAGPETHFWNFLVINEQREIDGIKEKLYGQLEPIIEEKTIDKGEISGSEDFVYELFCLETPKNHVDFPRVYQGKFKWDRRLQPRKSRNGWSTLIDKISSGEI